MTESYINKTSHFNRLLWGVAGISWVISLITLFLHDPINQDGIIYIRAATLFRESGFHAAMSFYPWPFFSILIAMVSQTTHLSLIKSAYFINSFFQAIIAIAFVMLIKEIDPDKEHVRWGALVILLFPYLNSIRDLIIRDFGYWAFALLALWCLIRYTRQYKWCYALGWSFFMVVATLFRVEGAVLLVLAPLIFLWPNDQTVLTRIKNTLKLYVIPILGMGIIFAWFFYHQYSFSEHLGRGMELIQQARHGLVSMIQTFNYRADLFSKNHEIFPVDVEGNAKVILIGGLISVFIVGLIKTLNLFYLLLMGYSQYHQLWVTSRTIKRIVWSFALINCIVLFVFIGQLFFVDKRYLVLLCLTLMLWIPISLVKIRQIKPQWVPVLNGVLCIMAMSGIFHFGYSKAYIMDAGLWIKDHTPQDIKLYSNSPEVLIYAEKKDSNWDTLKKPSLIPPIRLLEQYDYIAYRINVADKINEKDLINKSPIKLFKNKRGDRVVIYSMGENKPLKY